LILTDLLIISTIVVIDHFKPCPIFGPLFLYSKREVQTNLEDVLGTYTKEKDKEEDLIFASCAFHQGFCAIN
jgi:hypothetical protein